MPQLVAVISSEHKNCAYHSTRLLAEWEEKLVPLHSDRVRYGSTKASFTPPTNLHLDHVRPLEAFLRDEHPRLDSAALAAGIKKCLAELAGEPDGVSLTTPRPNPGRGRPPVPPANPPR